MTLPEEPSRTSVDSLLTGEYQRHANFSEVTFKKLYDDGSKKLWLPSLYKGDATQMYLFTKEIMDRSELQRLWTIVTIHKHGKAYNLLNGWIHLTVTNVRLHQAQLIAKYHADPTAIKPTPVDRHGHDVQHAEGQSCRVDARTDDPI